MNIQRLGMILIGLILFPAAGWFSAPYVALFMAPNCKANAVNVFHEAGRDVITHTHWWFSSGMQGGNGTYSTEIRYIDRNGVESIKNILRTYELKYSLKSSHWRVETTRMTRLSGDGNHDSDIERYIDPLVKTAFTAPIMMFKLSGNNYMLGINERPRTLCQ